MAVINLQRRARELGRIRMGDRGAKGQPQRLSSFRLTSADRTLLQAAAVRYGGEVRAWGEQFELYTEAAELPCMVTPQEVSQWYELWSGGGCQRRCDGQENVLTGDPCACDPDQRECKLVTRLSVMLHELPGVGVWRLETHGYHAATELPASAEVLIRLAQRGQYAPAALAIEQRVVKRDGQTKKFPVPVLRIAVPLGTLMTGEMMEALPEPQAALPESTGDRRATEAVQAAEQAPSYAAEAVNGPKEPNPRGRYHAMLKEHALDGMSDAERHLLNGILIGKHGTPVETSSFGAWKGKHDPKLEARQWKALLDAFESHCTDCAGGAFCDLLQAAKDELASQTPEQGYTSALATP